MQTIEPRVTVGILSGEQIAFRLLSPYLMEGTEVSGAQTAIYNKGKIEWGGRLYDELLFTPQCEPTDSFELQDVTIGINFHWERKETQRFLGALKLIVEDDELTAVNVIRVEDYLTSVISSEMSATASLELLKAHAVISRSWLLRNISYKSYKSYKSYNESSGLRWYDRTAHTHFDVCADDHCQRYQGITRASTEAVRRAIAETRGQVLTYDGEICDARFSKCCGGILEEFQYCWEDVRYPYLRAKRDCRDAIHSVLHSSTTQSNPKQNKRTNQDAMYSVPTSEAEADHWIRTTPDAFCHTTDKRILSQVLNNYDQETTDFYRWRVTYTQEELSRLIRERSGTDYGQILDLVPVAHGTSGRIWKLKIVGTRQTCVIGKELEIRRTLSPSHLYSSAFVVDKEEISPEGIPARFILTGAGWGHGVGLCQIGAAVMGEQGYKYDEILLHYYIGAKIEKAYE